MSNYWLPEDAPEEQVRREINDALVEDFAALVAGPDTERGLCAKYTVFRRLQPGEKGDTLTPVADECFVLKAGDPYAVVALAAYAQACAQTYPQLSGDLAAMAQRWLSES
jgi:hypothetical protein